MRGRTACGTVRAASGEEDGAVTASPTWLEGARHYEAKRPRTAHHDGTCDALYPGTWNDRDGRCVLAEGHTGAHVYRDRGPARKPSREQAYRAARDEKRRVARLALRCERRERACRIL
jgi:hypothetical protein